MGDVALAVEADGAHVGQEGEHVVADAMPEEKDAVRVDRRLPATPEEVFDAWTDPATLQKFMVPHSVLRARVRFFHFTSPVANSTHRMSASSVCRPLHP